jgi:hypothetical protein
MITSGVYSVKGIGQANVQLDDTKSKAHITLANMSVGTTFSVFTIDCNAVITKDGYLAINDHEPTVLEELVIDGINTLAGWIFKH